MGRKINKLNLNNIIVMLVLFFGAAILFAESVSARHLKDGFITRGSIIEIEGEVIYLCLGSNDGAKVGMELDVFHISLVKKDNVAPRLRSVSKNLRRQKTGIIQITGIIDEHFATAKIISGKVDVHDIVEFQNKAN